MRSPFLSANHTMRERYQLSFVNFYYFYWKLFVFLISLRMANRYHYYYAVRNMRSLYTQYTYIIQY